MNKLDINNEMYQLDTKNRAFYDELSDEEKKKFSNYLMIRWGSSVIGEQILEEYYLFSCNEKLNKHFFDISDHPKLQWLCATTISPGIGKQRHEWIKLKKRESTDNKALKLLKEIYPTYSIEELELLLKINTKNDLKQLARNHGYDEKRIKSEL
jgi:hypothetical protein